MKRKLTVLVTVLVIALGCIALVVIFQSFGPGSSGPPHPVNVSLPMECIFEVVSTGINRVLGL